MNVSKIPEEIQEKVNSFPESSYGAHRVTVVMDDGTEYQQVYIAGCDEIIRVGESQQIPFDPRRIVDVRNEA